MYSVSSPCQETSPCQKPQPYQELLQPCQELVHQIQMCARRAHYPNMQLYNLVLQEKQIYIQYFCTQLSFYLDEIDITSYKPSVAYKKSFHKLTQCHKQRVTTRHISCIIYRIIISYKKSLLIILCKRYSYLYQKYQ